MHPLRPSWLLSASRDHSLRLWHVGSGVLALIMAGEGGHRAEVISCDWHLSQRCTAVSGGMDGCVKVWAPDDGLFARLAPALLPPPAGPGAPQPPRPRPLRLQAPRFSTQRVHQNFVDCVRFVGDAVLSKSVDSRILLWLPESDPGRAQAGHFRQLALCELQEADLWFTRFGLDARRRLLACGNSQGGVRLWDVHCSPPRLLAQLSCRRTEAARKGKGPPVAPPPLPVRQCWPSPDGRTLLACCEDGTLWRWDAREGVERGGAGGAGEAEMAEAAARVDDGGAAAAQTE